MGKLKVLADLFPETRAKIEPPIVKDGSDYLPDRIRRGICNAS